MTGIFFSGRHTAKQLTLRLHWLALFSRECKREYFFSVTQSRELALWLCLSHLATHTQKKENNNRRILPSKTTKIRHFLAEIITLKWIKVGYSLKSHSYRIQSITLYIMYSHTHLSQRYSQFILIPLRNPHFASLRNIHISNLTFVRSYHWISYVCFCVSSTFFFFSFLFLFLCPFFGCALDWLLLLLAAICL